MNVFILLNTKEDILKNVGNRAVLGTIDFNCIFFSYYGGQMCPKTAWLQTFFIISSFVFSRTKTFKQVWTYLSWGWVNYDNFHFLGWTTPLKEQSPLNKSSAKLFMCKSLSNGSSSNSLSCSAKANSFRCDAFTSKASKMYQEQMKLSLSNLCYFYKFMDRNHALFVTYSICINSLGLMYFPYICSVLTLKSRTCLLFNTLFKLEEW